MIVAASCLDVMGDILRNVKDGGVIPILRRYIRYQVRQIIIVKLERSRQ